MREYYQKNKHKIDKDKCRAATLRHYYRNKTRLNAQTIKRQSETQAMIDEIKSTPCGYPPYVMDFDHVRGVKKFQIGGSCGRSLQTLADEIAKCDIVCSNCHRIRTFGKKHPIKRTAQHLPL